MLQSTAFREEKLPDEEKFTLGEFSDLNMKICGRRNVRKHREIKGSDKYVTLDISLRSESLNKMIITSSESKVKLGRSGKGLITYLGLKAKTRAKKYKSQVMPMEMSVRRTSQRFLGSLKNHLMKVMTKRGQKMSLLTVIFTYKDSLKIL